MQLLAQTSTSSSDAAAGLAALLGGGAFLVASLIFLVVFVAIYYVIMGRTGYNPWLSLLILIPGLGGLILLVILVFTEWPVQREVRALRAQLGSGGGAGYGSGPYGAAGGLGSGPAPGGPIMPT